MSDLPFSVTPFVVGVFGWFFAFWAVVGIVLGALLMVSPASVRRGSEFFNRWRSGRRMTRPFERLVLIEPLVYRHHRPVGIALTLGGLYTTVLLWGSESPTIWDSVAGSLIGDAAKTLLLAGNAVGAGVGVLVALRPSSLKQIESYANQWVSTRQMTRRLETMNYAVDNGAARYPRSFGLLLIVSGIYLLSLTASGFG